jgi:predicted HAD superfamily Cof-like phosphohydrolase
MNTVDLQKTIQEPNALNKVAQFHRLFQHPVLESPQIPSKQRTGLRVSLIQEELNELKEAIEKNDIVEVADALADLQYVLSGTILEFGMKDKFTDIFNEVHRSNMTKACKTEDEAIETVKSYKKGCPGVEYHYELIEGKYLVYRTEDRKTLKSIYYEQADIFGILHGDGARFREGIGNRPD